MTHRRGTVISKSPVKMLMEGIWAQLVEAFYSGSHKAVVKELGGAYPFLDTGLRKNPLLS